jgi:ADP-ribose pyrophosphatase YjhB (NUDIX family)
MHNYQTIKIDGTFNIKILPEARGFELSDVEKAEVESIWDRELREKSQYLVNGRILNVVSSESLPWIGEFVEYKFYIAQLRNPHFKERLQIRPMGISGMTTTGGKILIGQRSSEVTLYQNHYETVPSGGVEPTAMKGDFLDLKNQFELELFEETGISSTEIKQVDCFAVVYDPSHDHYQICAEIQVNYSILGNVLKPSWEYTSLKWLSKAELKPFLLEHSQQIVPLTEYMLSARGYIKSYFITETFHS